MKQNPGGPVFERDENFILALTEVFGVVPASERPQVIIETGTYLGTGTTQQVFEAFDIANKGKAVYKPKFFSIEVNENNYNVAKKLSKLRPWTTFIHGSSVDLQDAKFFVKHDDYLINHENYPDIYYDAENPVDFYLAEIEGMLDFYGTGEFGKNNVLEDLIEKHKDKRPLFILDSAGGIGYLEFRYIVEEMGDKKYYLFARGINHVKHARSYQQIKNNEDVWKIWTEGPDWVLATHRARALRK